ncbi:MAG: polyribonucleotide nucleotidyltransferase [Candidatus Marinimicrobia bacterium]|jgi:polyribonucleotide nucleotidyltransferase|nr:polyribonucleotide nucleotidyltransferase [Candidatus Neomarinimicrobiota bacterium]MBT3618188.1 polyribonucleotide nucleotidyltransferase [Candidatus Neomarinimicrobiota bacterium]MBT3828659.1 polyribonucleotide nucleotidyltransferase [Candidatus Neomarinimicrobiota bacterium]MBT3996879.1 polyribonucleotide nucleotidyltransferase [Candidatus Neomarinimicrobiota bacterium]MBT4280843.1 polyribonucleotide nucleotidyltransferase [Candidatus Neomarinimicrobiota bacterium]
MLKKEMELGGRTLSIQTGTIARQAAGSVIVTYGETCVIIAVNAAKEVREGIDFFPLQVEYRERHYAGGKIPGGFFKREARPSEHEILTSRLTDRPIRPLFPKSFKYETQVIATVLSSDGENMADTLTGIGASAALMISDIPWNGPIATVRVGRLNDSFVINPTREEMNESDMEIMVSGNENTVVMVEGEAKNISEEDFVLALEFAQDHIKEIIDLQKSLVAECDVVKRPIPESEENEDLAKEVKDRVASDIDNAIQIADKHDREKAIDDIHEKTQLDLEETYPDNSQLIKDHINTLLKEAFRENILAKGIRSDGRSTTDIRPITIESGLLPRTHGSALFTRGETQALVVLTLGSPRDEQIVDSMDLDTKKNFMLHYNFPPYCVGETGRIGFTSRREIGHGNLAQRALKQVLPDYDDFPYTIRIVSEIMESNGSSSMASICGGSLALMNSGAQIKGHVAGIAMGLITDGKRNAILSDILGAEDHLGDMDFKVAGTREGITAIQLDLKIEGISFELLKEALAQAKTGREHILDIMYDSISDAQTMSEYAPKILSIQIAQEKIGGLIGPGGKTIKKIIADTECEVNVDDDGMVTAASLDLRRCQEAIELVKAITLEPEVGMEFDGTVTRLMTFGAFVEFAPGREGLVHISELEWSRVEKVEDVLNPGDKVRIKLIKVDDQGRLDFSRKALLEKPEGWTPPPKRDDHRGGRGNSRGNKPFRKKRF